MGLPDSKQKSGQLVAMYIVWDAFGLVRDERGKSGSYKVFRS